MEEFIFSVTVSIVLGMLISSGENTLMTCMLLILVSFLEGMLMFFIFSSWMMFILILIFSSGMMVVFVYVSVLSGSQKLSLGSYSILVTSGMFWFQWGTNDFWSHRSKSSIEVFSLYSELSLAVLLYLLLYLMLLMFLVVSVSEMPKGELVEFH